MKANMDESIREARRQRILRNSEKRLQKILGTSDASVMSNQAVEDSELKFNSPALMEEIKFQHSQVLFESLEPSDTIRSRHRNPEQVSHSDVLSNIPLISNNLDKGMGFGELETKQTTKEESESFLHSLLVLLAISAVTMLNFGLGAIIGNNALVPFVGFEVYRTFFKRTVSPPTGGLLNTALLLSGIPKDKLAWIFKGIGAFKFVLHDLCIYIFVCLLCNHVYHMWQ